MVASPSLRIVYFGTPAFAVPSLVGLIGSRHQVVGLVSQPDRPKGRGHRVQVTPTKQIAVERGIPVFQPERIKDPWFVEQLAALESDLGVVAAYGRILPDPVLSVPRFGMINVHASILPKYRGAAPVQRAIMAGETETGVTIMRVVRELDAGPTFAMRRRPIGEDETSLDVERGLAELGVGVLVEVVDAIAEGRSVERPQDEARATFAPKLTKEDGRIDWTLPADLIQNRVRGLHPWPLASACLNGARILIHRAKAAAPPQKASPQNVPATFSGKVPATLVGGAVPSVDVRAQPGSIVAVDSDAIIVLCGDGNFLRILNIQPEGSRAMTVREYLAGHKILPGARLEPA
jgi:methionyl-tRNA formyltransferase